MTPPFRMIQGRARRSLAMAAIFVCGAVALPGSEKPGPAGAPPAFEDAPYAPGMFRWNNREGRGIDASLEGRDGPEHILIKPGTGIVHRYPIGKLAPWSQELARSGGQLRMESWSPGSDGPLAAAFEGMDGPDHALLRLEAGARRRYPVEAFPLEEQLRIRNGGDTRRVSVLFIGDSLSLCGFGKRLDQRLRNSPGVRAVATYMACGTNPLSWLKARPYTNVKTHCGFWSIESVEGEGKPREIIDTYGMRAGYKPAPHVVPKLETLLATLKPELLVIQCGNNLFSAFRDGKTVSPKVHGEILRAHIAPLVSFLASHASSLRRVYWVTPPRGGSVSDEIQSFVFEQIQALAAPVATIVDSRTFTRFPYARMAPDKEHFWGKEADEWADRVHEIVSREALSPQLLALPRLHERVRPPVQSTESAPPPAAQVLRLRARLLAKTPFPQPDSFAPYQEFLVGYRYAVRELLEGRYAEKEILVMHPAYIRLRRQAVEQWETGRDFEFRLRRLDAGSLWNAHRRDDRSDSLHLEPYLLVEDEGRHPDARPERDAAGSCPCAATR